MVTAGTNSTVIYTSGSHKYVPCPFFVTADGGDCRQRGLQYNYGYSWHQQYCNLYFWQPQVCTLPIFCDYRQGRLPTKGTTKQCITIEKPTDICIKLTAILYLFILFLLFNYITIENPTDICIKLIAILYLFILFLLFNYIIFVLVHIFPLAVTAGMSKKDH